MDDEQVLASDGVTYVVRVGDTVRRPARPFTATIQSYLKYLHEHGFHDAPTPMGYDEQGREVLSFVAGDVPQEPLPDYACTDDVLAPLGRLIRRLHDAAADFTPPVDAVWGGIPGTPAGVVPLFEKPELISHQDYCPGNVVFRDGLPAAFIDFDLSRPRHASPISSTPCTGGPRSCIQATDHQPCGTPMCRRACGSWPMRTA